MQDPTLLIFHHLPKTGGTSLRALIRDNYEPDAIAEPYGEISKLQREGAKIAIAPNEADWYRVWYESLGEERRTQLRCVASHTANQLMPILDRPFRALALLRDPVDRVWSLYHFVRLLAERGRRGRGGLSGLELCRRDWDLADLYRELGDGGSAQPELRRLFNDFFNGQASSILAPWVDRPRLERGLQRSDPDVLLTDEVLDVLRRHYVVGAYEQYDRSLERFASAFGWRRLSSPHVNRSAARQPPDPETRALIRAHNKLDAELHARYSAKAP